VTRPHRKSIRLPDDDYASAGAYFVTICTARRRLSFEDARIREVTLDCWLSIPRHFTAAAFDEFVIMPNHIHGIVILTDDVAAQHAAQLRPNLAPSSLGVVVRSFKAAVTKTLRGRNLWNERPFWQPNYYERVIRSEDELNRIREYVQYNPTAWLYDHENPSRKTDANHERRWAWLEDHEPSQA
jgi:putative transposase